MPTYVVIDTECVTAQEEHHVYLAVERTYPDLVAQRLAPRDGSRPSLHASSELVTPRWPFKRIIAASAMHLTAECEEGALSLAAMESWDGEKRDEAGILRAVSDYLAMVPGGGTVLVTYNGKGHDVPLLLTRMMKHRLIVPAGWRFLLDGRRYHEQHLDLMDVFTHFGAARRVHMSELAAAIGVPAKMVSGPGEIAQLAESGKWSLVRGHVEGDVITAALLLMRWRSLSQIARSAFVDEMMLVRALQKQRGHRRCIEELTRWAGGFEAALFAGAQDNAEALMAA